MRITIRIEDEEAMGWSTVHPDALRPDLTPIEVAERYIVPAIHAAKLRLDDIKAEIAIERITG